jgi:methyl-accepting chemotaxis protein
MSLLTQPFELSARLIQRMVDDVSAIAAASRELPGRMQELDERAARMQDQLDRALDLGEKIADNTAAMVAMAERMESRGQSMIDLGERMITLGNTVTEQSESIARALAIASPLEGTVERLGRALDRLPGGRPPGRAQRNVTSDDEP